MSSPDIIKALERAWAAAEAARDLNAKAGTNARRRDGVHLGVETQSLWARQAQAFAAESQAWSALALALYSEP